MPILEKFGWGDIRKNDSVLSAPAILYHASDFALYRCRIRIQTQLKFLLRRGDKYNEIAAVQCCFEI